LANRVTAAGMIRLGYPLKPITNADRGGAHARP
jgi:hypothetical protein